MCVEGDGNLSIVGDECHIVAQEKGGPRSTLTIPGGDLDGYDNLILLCKIHHKCCDDHPDVYPVERIVSIKGKHEKWVETSLAGKKAPASPAFLVRVTTGKDLMNIIFGSHMYEHDHDELNTKEEVELVGGFLQNVHDWGDIGSDLEAGARVSAAFSMKPSIFCALHGQVCSIGRFQRANLAASEA